MRTGVEEARHDGDTGVAVKATSERVISKKKTIRTRTMYNTRDVNVLRIVYIHVGQSELIFNSLSYLEITQ